MEFWCYIFCVVFFRVWDFRVIFSCCIFPCVEFLCCIFSAVFFVFYSVSYCFLFVLHLTFVNLFISLLQYHCLGWIVGLEIYCNDSNRLGLGDRKVIGIMLRMKRAGILFWIFCEGTGDDMGGNFVGLGIGCIIPAS